MTDSPEDAANRRKADRRQRESAEFGGADRRAADRRTPRAPNNLSIFPGAPD